MTETRKSLSDRQAVWFRSMLSRRCAECGGNIPLSQLNGRARRRVWPPVAACEDCGTRWKIALTRVAYFFRFMTRAVPLSLLSVFAMAGALEYLIPEITYTTEGGLTKLRGVAFPFLVPAMLLPALVFAHRLPLEKETT